MKLNTVEMDIKYLHPAPEAQYHLFKESQLALITGDRTKITILSILVLIKLKIPLVSPSWFQ